MATDIPAAANVLGTLGAVCWSVQLIPQIVVNYRRHHAIGLQPTMMMLWAWAGVPLGVYNIVSDFNIALQIQPQILCSLSLLTWIQCYHYQRQWHLARSLAVVLPLILLMAAIEVGLVFALRAAQRRHTDWPLTLMAVLSAALLAAGVLRHYWDIWKHRAVRGISFIFVAIDAAGDLFSLLSLLFQPKLDVLGMVIYGTELSLWLGVCAAGIWYRGIKGQARDGPGVTIDTVTAGTSDVPRHRNESDGRSDFPETSTDTDAVPVDSIALHDIPSSTSVFRTVSSDLVARSRSSVSGSRSSSHISVALRTRA